MRTRFIIGSCLLLLSGLALAAPPLNRPDPKGLSGRLKAYDSRIYVLYTDVPEDDAREALIRMNKMAEEYHERTKVLFSGQLTERLPFYLFTKEEDYYGAGAIPKSAGVFSGTSLMAKVYRDQQGRLGRQMWHIVQHEGFHQFVHFVVGGKVPVWANEGLAEYFGEGLFTGDGMVTGIIPPRRLKRIKDSIEGGTFKTIKGMMLMSPEAWSGDLMMVNYDQAWSMVHFLAQGENGKYQDAFAKFLVLAGRGMLWEQAWVAAFGSVEGFEQKWKVYWQNMPENSTVDLYDKAAVAGLTSLVGRAYSQKQTFDSLEEFVGMEAKDLKAAPGDWLPPGLFADTKDLLEMMKKQGMEFSIVAMKGLPPQIVCVMPDGRRVTGTCTLKNGQIAKVTADISKPAATATKAAKKPPSQ